MTHSAYHALKSAYALLENVTPLKDYNCGEICGARCCSGSEKDGMLLFPYENELLENKGFDIIKTDSDSGEYALVCDGTCQRSARPLACRFFPLFPVIVEEDGHEKIKVMVDPRASICPLTDENAIISRQFVSTVRKAGYYLSRDAEIKEYMKSITSEILEIFELKSALGE